MDPDVQTYVQAIPATTRPLFDRIDALVHELHPEVEILITYDMPTHQVGTRRLYVAAWKNWVSFYGSERGPGRRLRRAPPGAELGAGHHQADPEGG